MFLATLWFPYFPFVLSVFLLCYGSLHVRKQLRAKSSVTIGHVFAMPVAGIISGVDSSCTSMGEREVLLATESHRPSCSPSPTLPRVDGSDHIRFLLNFANTDLLLTYLPYVAASEKLIATLAIFLPN
ncbi:hypothetical protein HD554DRAFT_2038202 [Boletus coccyginus]|nr:hypothetical protein HD554DRAFT_2038202 [Boletus coccyginus]